MAINELTYPIALPHYAHKAIDILEQAGYEAWCVGGFVRDALRGQTAHDVDIATSARWEEVSALFIAQGHQSFETGVKHGTVTVSIDSEIIEITTFRREADYHDARHPDTVTFVDSIEEDLARRDFTMNAIAYHPVRGLRDPFLGCADIEAKIIRSVGDPMKRFAEDALRILRACRFASQLGFTIEEETFKAMSEKKELLECISAERIAHELDVFFCGKNIHTALMACIEVIGQIVPEALDMKDFDQKTPYHIYDVLEHTAYCVQACPDYSLVRWAAFFHDIGKPPAFFTDDEGIGHFYGHAKISVEITRETMKRLKMSPRFTHKVLLLVERHDEVISAEPKAVKRALRRLEEDPELFRALCDLKRGDASAQAPHCIGRVQLADQLEQVLDEILSENEAFSLKDLAIGGKDVLGLGIDPGPRIGELLEVALDAVIEGEVVNDPESLRLFIAVEANKAPLT